MYYERCIFYISSFKTLLEPYRTVATILNWQLKYILY